MKILFFSHYYTPEGNAPATRVSALCERWVKAGHDVTVITCPPNVPNGVVYDGYANKRTSEEINGVKVERVKLYIAANKGAIKRMFNFVSYFFKALLAALRLPKPDVVVATSPQIFCGYVGVWYKRFRRVPLVIEIRDIWPESMEAVGAKIPRLAYKALEMVERAMYRAADRIVTVGEGYKARLLEKGIKAEKMSIIMNGTDLAVYKPLPKNEELLKQYGLDGKFVVSYIGTVGMACGLEVVLDAAEMIGRVEVERGRNGDGRVEVEKWRMGEGDDLSRVEVEKGRMGEGDDLSRVEVEKGRRDVIFVIVGDGAHRVQLEEEAKRRGLKNVVFTGRQPKSSMPDWIASSDASLVHLKASGLFTTVMPSKIFESAGCKRPIIMGVDGYAKKLVLDAEAGLDMKPESAESLIECTNKLAADPERCKRLGENAYLNIAMVHNRDKQAEDYIQVLQEIRKQ